MDLSTIIDVSANDDEYSRIGGTDDPELAWIAFKLRVSDGEDGGGAILLDNRAP